MRDFNDRDKLKKQARIRLEANPGQLSPEQQSNIAARVQASLKDGYLPCPAAWKIAREFGVPRIAVGKITDDLNIRIVNCQLGCFKIDKAAPDAAPAAIGEQVIRQIESIWSSNELTCAKMFELSRQLKIAPLALSAVATARNWKVRQCQLGCF